MKTVVCLFVLCAASLFAEEIGGVNFNLTAANENWKIGSTYKNDQQEVITYVLEEESPSQWSELFTAQVVKGLQLAPGSFFEMFLQQLKILAPEKTINSKILKQSDEELFAEWWIDAKTLEDQHEWVRMLQNNGAFVVLRYTTKSIDQIEKARAKGNALLSSAKILH